MSADRATVVGMETNRTIILSILAVLALAGCAPSEPETTTDRPPAVEVDTPYNLDESAIDELHLANVRDLAPELEAVPDANLIALGHAICEAFDAGASFDDVALIALGSGFSTQTGGTIIGSSVAAYCDEHLALLG